MIRALALIAYGLTLLCPVYCLVEPDACCADHCCGPEPRNCEAMAVGAIVAAADDAATAADRATPADLGPAPTPWPVVAGSPRESRLAAHDRAAGHPPPAATRQALLQVFRF